MILNPCLAGLVVIVSLLTWNRPLCAQENPYQEFVRNSQRIVFLGDSITWAGDYVAQVDAWLHSSNPDSPPEVLNLGLPSETVSGLSEAGHAGGRFPRPDLAERLPRILEKTKPDLVIACYGINCGIYQPLNQERFQKYQEGIQNLRTQTSDAGARLILMTPPVFDERRNGRSASYDSVMRHYANWLIAQRENGWLVVDLHAEMKAALEAGRSADAEFTFQPDGIHPNASGHQLMATTLIQWLDPEATLSEMDPDLFKQRMIVRRNFWLTHVGHQRPGLPKGVAPEEFSKTIRQLTEKIQGQ